jgi:lysophospholipase L1-like esterase
MRKLFFSLILLIATSVSGQIAISNLPTFNSVSDSAWVPALIGSTTYKIRGAKLKTTSTLQEVLNASSTFSKSNYINAFAKTLSVYNADSILLQSNNSIYLNATSGDVISQSLKANHNAYNNNHAFVTYNSSTGALKQSSLDSLIAYIKRQIPAYALTAGYGTTLIGSYPTQTISVDSSIIASKSFANAGFNTKLNIADTAGFATRLWSNNVHPRFDGTYNNPTWLNTLLSDKIVNYSATPFQALVSDGNGFFVPYTIPYVSTYDSAAMLNGYRHWLAGYYKNNDTGTILASKSFVNAGLGTKQNTLTNPITGTGVSGRVPFYTGTNTLSSNANYVWDNTNNWLGIGGNPLTNFHIQTPGGTAATLRLHQNGWNSWNLRSVASSTGFAIGDNTNNYFNIYSTGNVTIGNGNNGFRFEVIGNARVTTGLTLSNLTISRIPYIGTASLVTDNAGFTFDEATNRLRLGGANPILRFDPTVNSNANGLQWQTFGNNDASLNYNVSTGRFVINTGRNSTYGSRQSFNVDSTDVLVLQKATATINVPLFYPNLGSIQSGNSFSFANWGNKSSLQTTINYSLDGKLGLFNPNPSASLDLSRSARVRGGLFVDTTKSVSQIYCVGDSKTFIGIYERKLNELLGTNWNTNNKGVSGANTFGINTNFNRDVVEAGDADYVVIEAGINDIAQGFTFNDIKNNLQAMYTKAKNAGAAVVAVTISPFKNNASWTVGRQAILENVNRWILDTAIDVDFRVNSYAVLGGQGGDAAVLLSAYNSGDNLHLNTAGYEFLGTTIFSNATFTTKNFNGSAIKSTGDIEVFDSNKGAILKSPNGTRFRITVNNAGVLTTTAL